MRKLFINAQLAAIVVLLTSCGGSSKNSSAKVEIANTAPQLVGLIDFAIPENTTEVATFQATDAEGDTLTYSINGADADLLLIGPATGLLEFKSAPDFENPLDADEDNIYSLNIVASDDELSTALGIIISVTDVVEVSQPTINLVASKNEISAYNQVTISWSSENADTCSLNYNNDDVSIETAGSKKFYFSATGTKKIIVTCQNSAYEESEEIEINVIDITIKELPDSISLFKEE